MIGPFSRPFLLAALLAFMNCSSMALAEPWAAPGDMRLRSDLQRLNDAGIINIPLTAWPLSWGDISRGLSIAEPTNLDSAQRVIFDRVRVQTQSESASNDWRARLKASAAANPRIIRSFEDTPREDGEISVAIDWMNSMLAVNLRAAAVLDPLDGEEFRLDGTYLGLALGNWMLSAGWQERWWGPGWDGSLLLSTNARPSPGIAIQRNSSVPFKTKWLSWMGPWAFTSFMNQLDDERVVNDALLFGMRFSMRPVSGLEIGLSRTAQWCGDDRPCDLSAFFDMLVGNDNSGVNVAPEDEPGNQLAGIDIRWALPKQIPLAAYMQWIGEDGRDGKPLPGSWLRQLGVEFWGEFGSVSHRTRFEVSDTICREGGFGSADPKPNCAYNHSIYQTGYRYRERVIGHSIDGDGRSYSLGSTLVQSRGHSWNVLLRYMEINKIGAPDSRHSLSATPQEMTDIQVTHDRLTSVGRFYVGLGYSRLDDESTGTESDDVTGFVQWRYE